MDNLQEEKKEENVVMEPINNKAPNNKKWIFIIVGLLLVAAVSVGLGFAFSSSNNKGKENDKEEKEEEKKESTATPILYEVTKEGSDTKIYLFGSIHVADNEAYPLPDAVLNAYEESDYLAVEADMVEFNGDLEAQTQALSLLTVNDDRMLKDILKEETYNLLVEYLEENLYYNELFEYYRPVFLESLVANVQVEKTKLDSNKGIDMYFLSDAKENNKEVLEVESVNFQYKLLASFPDELYDFMIYYEITNEDENIENTKKLYQLWLKGDEEALIELLNEEEDISEYEDDYENLEEMLNDYDKKLVYDRNIGMADVAEEYFKDEKNVFFVVGAAHIVGDDALVDLLTERGYTVTRVNYEK